MKEFDFKEIGYITYIVLATTMILSTIEHGFYNFYPGSIGLKELDDFMAVLIVIELVWTCIYNGIYYYLTIKKERNGNKIIK